MIVRELIELLQKMPQDAHVIRGYRSEYDEVDEGQVTLLKAEDKAIVEHHGRYMTFEETHWRHIDGFDTKQMKFATVVHFQGN